ncbi:MAG: cysteine desulfurase [Ruminiclostridium sp.]|nr:cysteine desulfurase [Ruminiclostridium sp.]
MKNIYLDYAATTPLTEDVKKRIISLIDVFGNPSSLHSEGEQALEIITNGRKSVAKFINSESKDIIFTGGGCAGNTLAIKGYMDKHYCTLLYSPTAHKSILKCAENCNQKYALDVDEFGFINLIDLENWLKVLQDTAFVVIEYANSEIGTIQNVTDIVKLVHKYNGVIFVDCTGSVSTIPIDVKKSDIDILSFSAHKIGGLKGCGVLYKKSNISLSPLIYGTQENGLFGGTENVLGIASLGKAVENCYYSSVSSSGRDYVYNYIINNIPDCYLVGAPVESGQRLPHNIYMCFKGVEGESLMLMLDMKGIQVSTGSACSSGSLDASPTLTAIGMDENDMHSCIRMSFCGNESKDDLLYVCGALKQYVEQLRRFSSV